MGLPISSQVRGTLGSSKVLRNSTGYCTAWSSSSTLSIDRYNIASPECLLISHCWWHFLFSFLERVWLLYLVSHRKNSFQRHLDLNITIEFFWRRNNLTRMSRNIYSLLVISRWACRSSGVSVAWAVVTAPNLKSFYNKLLFFFFSFWHILQIFWPIQSK